MGILDKVVNSNKSEKAEVRLRDMISHYEKEFNNRISPETDVFLSYLSRVLKDPNTTPIAPLDMFVNVLVLMSENTRNFTNKNCYSTLRKAEDIYKYMFEYGEKTDDFEELSLSYYDLFVENGVIANNLFDVRLYNLFMDKHCYKYLMKALIDDVDACELFFPSLVEYAITARGYLFDEKQFASNLIKVIHQMSETKDAQLVMKDEIQKLERWSGVYDLDEISINKAEEQFIATKAMLYEAQSLLVNADQKIAALKQLVSSSTQTVEEVCHHEIANAELISRSAKQELDKAFDEFLEGQKKIVLLETSELTAQVARESEAKLKELQRIAQTITGTASAELAKLNLESSEIVSRLSNIASDSQSLKDAIEYAKANEDFMNKVRKIEILNDRNLDYINSNMSNNVANVSYADGSDSTITVSEEENAVSPEVNPLLDESIPFKERFEKIMVEKRKLEAEGVYFHEMFDDVLIAVLENANPYLIGPSGCGKTYMVGQIAKLLNMESVDIGYINEEYDILGFQTANGGYSKPNFYRCYKYGKIAFCDELDNGNSRATVKLNSFLVNTENASYNFPNGEHVARHNNFRIIGAGNTAGNGADANYNTREKIEESVQQRMTPIYVGYDNSVEEKIMDIYKNWYEFIVLFRMATDAWEKKSFLPAPGIITTRDAAKIKRYLVNKSFNTEQIMKYEIIQVKDIEYLSFLEKVMKDNIGNHSMAKDLLAVFSKLVDEMREKGIR